MSKLTLSAHLLSVLAVITLGTACTVGEAAPSSASTTFIDSDGDGSGDGVDTDGDGVPNYTTPTCPTCTPGSEVACTDPIVDADDDGLPEGLDLDCDGVIDIPLTHDSDGTGGGQDGSGGSSGNGGTVSQTSCASAIAINGDRRAIQCSSDNTGVTTCRCEHNNQPVYTCTTTLESPCDLSYPSNPSDNCCGF